MGTCTSLPDTRETYNLSVVKFNNLNEFSRVLGIRRSVIGRLRASFRRLDHDKSGSISMAEFLVMLHIDTNRFTKRAFSLIDSDNDGKVDFYEFVAAIWNYCTLDWESLVRFSFDLFDIDGSGELEINEIEKLVCYVAGKKKVDSRMRKILGIMDDNKDGKVNFNEFTGYNRKFPSILFPAFNMQMKLRTKVLGVPFWESRTVEMATLRAQKGITVKTVLDDIENKVIEERRAAQRAIKATTKPTVVATKKVKRKTGDKESNKENRKTKKKEENTLPPSHQYSQPEKITVGSKKSKKAKARAAKAELVDDGKDEDDYTLSTMGRILSPFSAKLKKKRAREIERSRKKKRSSYEDEDDDEESEAPMFTSNATVKTEIINFNVVNGDFVLRGSNMEKEAKKKSKKALRPSSTDIRGIQKDMARKELDKKFKRNSKKTVGQNYAKTKNTNKENAAPAFEEVPSPPPPPNHDSVENTWKKLSDQPTKKRNPLQPRRPRPLDTPPNKKKANRTVFSPFSPAAKKFAAAVMSPFSKKTKRRTTKKKERSVKFAPDIATSINLPDSPTTMSIVDFR
ncbi:hypothetical protein TrRE_jg6825 [Triparma retinervis]|uniref:EF-hand domain-containing protein n=1 Tax=Triparma retinervis TaxID=2557542 RepID=A0A9W6Z6H0_9STRA|nr:hypothetical protein TrRE_jg6825 [Triparma retinervis]